MSARYEVGELVDLALRGARVMSLDGDDLTVQYRTSLGEAELLVAIDGQGVSITRVAPAEWPPQPGDLWDDATGVRWVFTRSYDRTTPEKVSEAFFAVDQTEDRYHRYPRGAEKMLTDHGPMTLAYRKGWTPAAPAAAEQAEAEPNREGRAAIADGLRQLADLVERTDVPIPSVLGMAQDTGWRYSESGYRQPSDEEAVARVQAWADALGAQHRIREVGDTIHHTVDGRLAGVVVSLSCIVSKPAPDVAPPGNAVAVDAAEAATAPDFDLGPLPDADGDLIAPVDVDPCPVGDLGVAVTGPAGDPATDEAV